jgi:NACHT conflict system protein
VVKNGLAEVLDAAKDKPWILADGYELKDWLRLLPFVDRPGEAFSVVRSLPEAQRRPDFLEDMISTLATAPGDDAESVLFKLAEADPKLYSEHAWRDAVMRRGTLTAVRRLVDLAANGVLVGERTDLSHLARQIGGLIGEHHELRAHVYDLLNAGPMSPGRALLARAIAEDPDAEGLLLLIKIENEHERSFISWRTVENVVLEHVPAEEWEGAYNIMPVPAVELRRQLLAMTTDGGPRDAAARCLKQIDKTRDRYGAPESEPRHPDLASGRTWPIMARDPDASETG